MGNSTEPAAARTRWRACSVTIPRRARTTILGFVDVNRRPYYSWRAYTIGAMAANGDGTVYIGEDERISKLYLFYP